MQYQKLNDFLSAGKWREADEETATILLKIVGRLQSGGSLQAEDIEHSLSKHLPAIDQLWLKHSKEKFGFSVQKRLCRNLDTFYKFELWIEKSNGNLYSNVLEIENGDFWRHLAFEAWMDYSTLVGWYSKESKDWLAYKNLNFTINAPKGHLPARTWLLFSEHGNWDPGINVPEWVWYVAPNWLRLLSLLSK